MNLIKAVLKKEFRDSLRDRRAIMVAILPALLAPLLMAFMFHTIAKTKVSTDELTIQVIGKENAPDLISYLEQRELKFEDYQGDAKKDIQDETVKLILEIPDDYAEKFDDFKTATVYIHADRSMTKSRSAVNRLDRHISNYGSTIGSMRLIIRGVNPAISRAVTVKDKDYSTDASRAGQILAGIQMFFLMAAFFGSAPVAIDTTAGERERKSLEPLLVHPLSSFQIMAGKWLTVVSYGLLAIIITVISTATAFDFISLKSLGLDPKLTITMQLSMVLLLIPIAMFAASLQMLTSLFAKTFKEAQSYLGLVALLPIAPVMATMIGGAKSADWMYMVPILGQQQLLTTVLRGESIDWMNFITASGVTVLISIAIVIVLTRLLRSERVVYGG
ncbi:MAG: sodium transport system permease protein [Enterobacterales bacterium]|jgi:sodium transport system permease protein